MRSRRGFTLIEVMVALMLAGTVALLAHRVFAAALDGSEVIGRQALTSDRTQNGERFLSAMLLSVAVGTEGDQPFKGEPDQMHFGAWLETANGWFERCPVSLELTGGRLEASMASGTPLVLGDSIAAIHFEYLLELGAESRWVREWVSSVTAPLAVRLSVTRQSPHAGWPNQDNSRVYLIKARG